MTTYEILQSMPDASLYPKTIEAQRAFSEIARRHQAKYDAELEALRRGTITAGHARALLSCEDDAVRQRMLLAAAEGASVRELERMAGAVKRSAAKGTRPKPAKSSFCSEVELSLRNEMHRKVQVQTSGGGKGTLTVEFYNEDELAEFARRLAGNEA